MNKVPSLSNHFGIDDEGIVGIMCASDELSLDPLLEKIALAPPHSMNKSSALHDACLNKKVTLEIVQCTLDASPEAPRDTIQRGILTPLHLACFNENCPSSVIKLLVTEYPSALRQFRGGPNAMRRLGMSQSVGGLPLHYYLSRTLNMDIETIKILVDAYPEGLKRKGGDRAGYTPLDTLLRNTSIANLNDILQYIIHNESSALQMTNGYGEVPLHVACGNKNIDPKTIQMLLDCWPESNSRQDYRGSLPIHVLCENIDLDQTTSVNILALLIKASPVTVQHMSRNLCCPFYLAIEHKSPEFCELLVDAYPDSLNIESRYGRLPIHYACMLGKVDTVKYLLEIHPEHIHMSDDDGTLPIHFAAMGGKFETIKFLLMQDPDGAAKTTDDLNLPLHMACQHYRKDLSTVQLLFDSYPDAIYTTYRSKTPLDVAVRWRAQDTNLIQFLEIQMAYALTAQTTKAMNTLDDNGWLPLHRALNDNATLGSIKLLAKSNPAALTVADNQGMLPLHIACEFSSAGVVKFLVARLNDDDLNRCYANNHSPLHYACRGGNCGAVKHLLDRGITSVSERSSNNKLPVHLLLVSEAEDGRVDRESPEYLEAIWLLLVAHPETLLNLY